MDHKDIIDIIKNKDKILMINQEQMEKTLDELKRAAMDVDIISSISLHSKDLSNSIYRHGSDIIDLHQIIELKKKKEREHVLDLQSFFTKLSDQKDTLNRIWTCYHSLPSIQYEILNRLYEKNEPWKKVEAEMGIAHRKFCSLRIQALDQVISLFESDSTEREIINSKYNHYIKE